MGENPLRDVEWPREKNPRRPVVASEDRYRRTLEHCDAVDPRGRLRCILALARFSGRRETAICSLRASDVLLTREHVRQALAATGQDEGLAAHMPWGAIVWRPETDELGFEEVTPISRPARTALEAYLRAHPKVGDAVLFPRDKDATRPVSAGVAGNWLERAERRAELPKLERGLYHPYRRLFAVEGKHLPDQEVAKAGGWRDVSTMKRAYQRPEAVGVLWGTLKSSKRWGADTPRTHRGHTRPTNY